MKSRITYIITLLAFLLLTPSCEMREVLTTWDYENLATSQYILYYDWSELDEDPTGMSVYLYEINGDGFYHFKSNRTDRFEVIVPKGDYRILSFNQTENEFAHLTFYNLDDWGAAEVYAKGTPVNADPWVTRVSNGSTDVLSNLGFNNNGLLRPGSLAISSVASALYDLSPQSVKAWIGYEAYEELMNYVASTRGFNNNGLLRPGNQGLLRPGNVINNMSITAHIAGFENAIAVSGSISGLAAGCNMASSEPLAVELTQQLDEWKMTAETPDRSLGRIHTSFGTFGRLSDANYMPGTRFDESLAPVAPATRSVRSGAEENILTLKFLLRDGTTQYFVMNVTDQIDLIANELELELGSNTLGDQDNIELPEVEDKTGGFHPSVESWGDTIVHEINL